DLDAAHPRERVVVERRPQCLDLGQALTRALQPLDRDDLRQVTTAVQRRATAHRERSIEQAERAVVTHRSLIWDRADLAVLGRRQRRDRTRGFRDELGEGPFDVHAVNLTLSYITVK